MIPKGSHRTRNSDSPAEHGSENSRKYIFCAQPRVTQLSRSPTSSSYLSTLRYIADAPHTLSFRRSSSCPCLDAGSCPDTCERSNIHQWPCYRRCARSGKPYACWLRNASRDRHFRRRAPRPERFHSWLGPVDPLRQPRDIPRFLPDVAEHYRLQRDPAAHAGTGQHRQALELYCLHLHPRRQLQPHFLRGVAYQRPAILLHHALSGDGAERPSNGRVHERDERAAGLPTVVFSASANPMARWYLRCDAATPYCDR